MVVEQTALPSLDAGKPPWAMTSEGWGEKWLAVPQRDAGALYGWDLLRTGSRQPEGKLRNSK